MSTIYETNIKFFYETAVSLKNRNNLKRFIQKLLKKEGQSISYINYVFCSNKRILEINRSFLKHDYFTDIITFQLSGKNQPLEAEIYISVDEVKGNARLLRNTISNEFHRVIFHGALHLCGYQDQSASAKKQMRLKEDHYLSLYFK